MATASKAPSKPLPYLWLAAITAVIGLFVHGYLYSHSLAMESGEATKSLCDINATFNCSAVSASKYASLFGVPIALWGLIGNAVFLIMLGVMLPLADDTKKSAARRNVLIVAIGIFIASIIMGSISAFALAKLCAFCMAAYVLSILMLVFVWLGLKNRPSDRAAGPKDLIPLIAIGAIGLLAGFIIHSSMNPGAKQMAIAADGYVGEWKSAPAREINLVDPLVLGPAADQAKMTIVEFADFRCIHCKHAAPIIHAFAAAHPDVRVEFQPWPLDGECNASLDRTNGASCLLSRAVWCAQKVKQQGWAAHDYIYGLDEIYPSVEAVRAGLPAIATAAKMSTEEMNVCADSDDAKAATRKQAEVGTALNLQGTPTIFANKKILSGGQSLPILQRAYNSL